MLEDIAVLTHGEMISEDLCIKLENVTLDMFGKAKKVRVEKETTTIVDGSGKKRDIEARIAQIKRPIEETTSDCDKEKRATSVAPSWRWAGRRRGRRRPSNPAVNERQAGRAGANWASVDDALNATRAAVEEGVVAGGGVALLKASLAITVDGAGDSHPMRPPALAAPISMAGRPRRVTALHRAALPVLSARAKLRP